MQIYILLGAPGAGKGTNAKPLCEGGDFEVYSTGQTFRDEVAAETELGKRIKGFIDTGDISYGDSKTKSRGYLRRMRQ